MRRSFLGLLAVCGLAVLIAGCGSSGGTESSTNGSNNIQTTLARPTHSLNKAELIQFSRKVCANITKEIDGDFERFASEHGLEAGEQPTPTEVSEIGEEIQLPLLHKQDREMINAGKDNRTYNEVHRIFEVGEEEVREWSPKPAVAATDPGRVWAKTNPMLKSHGFITCVRDKPLVE